MSDMTDDVRDQILRRLSTGAATVSRLATGLGLPGGVVSYQLKLLERDGLVRVSGSSTIGGASAPAYVSTAAAAAPPLPVPPPLPGLTWTGTNPYPAPVWTTPQPPPSPTASSSLGTSPAHPAPAHRAAAPESAAPESAAPGSAGPEFAGPEFAGPGSAAPGSAMAASATLGYAAPGSAPTTARFADQADPTEPAAAAAANHDSHQSYVDSRTAPRRLLGAGAMRSQLASSPGVQGARPAITSRGRGPQLFDMRRIPLDDATFYEFASRLDALTREFAARATPGAPAAELFLSLHRPDADPTAGYGS
jgi:helix-turn-helix protein